MRPDHARPVLSWWAAFALLAALLGGCFPSFSAATSSPVDSRQPAESIPGVQGVAETFLKAWQRDDFPSMYALLTQVSRDAVELERFEEIYRDAEIKLALQSLDVAVMSVLNGQQSAQVGYRAVYHTALLGDLQRDIVMDLRLERGEWRVAWDEGLILPELKGGNRLSAEYTVPARGDIYDQYGKTLAGTADGMAVAVNPAELDPDQEEALLTVLSRLLGRTPESIQEQIHAASGDYLPLGETPSQEVSGLQADLADLKGLIFTPYRSRYYFDGGVAPQVTGYVLSIPPEELESYQRKGYSGDEKVGAAGLEAWGEEYLAGRRGESLYVISPQNKIVTRLAESEAAPSSFIYTTLDKDLQAQTQRAIEGFRGAVVVLERDSGRVLAMASSPSYDPNLFEPTNANSAYLLGETLSDGEQRLLNRATQGSYPLGSVSKIITMAAALESGEFSAASSYNCGHTFTELGNGQTLYDWTYEHGIAPSGVLSLPEGLMLSCNPWFWHIGLQLYRDGKTTTLSEMARGFGLGSATGLEQLPEATGSFPDPAGEGDAVQEAIGQGPMLVTPLQVAVFVAAVGNGGTLYQPRIIDKVASPDGDALISYEPLARGRLPVSARNLAIIQDAMRSVVEDRRGTARNVFTGLQIPVYGKTGTAQNAGADPHAWFAGYTDAGRADRPDIAVVVLAENAGEGSLVAAPIFRRVVEIYFSGKPIKLYPWESSFYVVPTLAPTPTETALPSLTPSLTPWPTLTPSLTPTPTQTRLPTLTSPPPTVQP